MRPILLVMLLLVAFPKPSVEQIPVTDGALLGLESSSWVRQAADMARQIAELQQQFRVQVGTLGSLLRTVTAGPAGLAREIGALNPMPEVRQLESMAQGFTHGGNPLNGMVSQILRGNGLYAPSSLGAFDTSAALWSRQAVTMGNFQVLAQQSLQSAERHLAGIDELRSQLDSGTAFQSQADLAALQARIASEHAALGSQQVQLQSLTLAYTAQQRAADLSEEQAVKNGALTMFANPTGQATPQELPTMPASFSSIQ